MKRFGILFLIFCVLLALGGVSEAGERLKLATTTSTENSGLLRVILPPFEKETGMKVDVISVGTGAALKLGENGDADLVLVHAPALEAAFVEAGFGVNRRNVMYNDFIILGPKSDPAGIRLEKNPAAALARIAKKGSPFISRGDNSGTHVKEQELWRDSGLPLVVVKKFLAPAGKAREIEFLAPAGDWYLSIGQGMSAALLMADEKEGYCLADRGTYLAFKDKIGLEVLVEGDPRLFNPYGVIAVNPERFPDINYRGAMALIAWLTSVEGQKMIGDFRIGGEPLFIPTAVKPEKAGPR